MKNNFLVHYGIFLASTVAIVAAIGCGAKAEVKFSPSAAAQAASAAPVADENIPTSSAIDAVMRGMPHAKRVCYEDNFNGYILDYGPPLDPGATEDGFMHGSFLVQNVKFYKSSNGTWFIGDQPDEAFIPIFPDYTNLPCKQR